MAFEMSFTAPFGITCAESYWRPVLVAVDKSSKSARILFYGYADSAAATANAEPIGRKEYGVSGDGFTASFGVDALNPEGKNPYAAAYAIAVATLDCEAQSATPETPATYESFFSKALPV